MTDFSFCGKNVPLKMTNITLTCSTIGEYSGMSPQAQSKIYSELPASWNCRIQGWLLLTAMRVERKKKIDHSNASIPRRSSRCPPRYRYSFTGSLLIASCQAVLLPIVWAAPQKTCTRCDGLNESQRLYCPACRITTLDRARLRPKKSLRIPAIQTTASSHCCSQKSLANPWGQYREVLEQLLHPSYPDT